MREKLIELLTQDDCPLLWMQGDVGNLADYLISHGVTIERTVDLSGKCGSCTYAKPVSGVFGNAKCYVRCTNEKHLKTHCKRVSSELRQRTHKACKSYVPLPEPPKGE